MQNIIQTVMFSKYNKKVHVEKQTNCFNNFKAKQDLIILEITFGKNEHLN